MLVHSSDPNDATGVAPKELSEQVGSTGPQMTLPGEDDSFDTLQPWEMVRSSTVQKKAAKAEDGIRGYSRQLNGKERCNGIGKSAHPPRS